VTVFFTEYGTSKMLPLDRAKGLKGSHGIRWYEGKRQRQQIIGEDASAATAAKLRKVTELKKAALGIVAQSRGEHYARLGGGDVHSGKDGPESHHSGTLAWRTGPL
jgi:hypothetical protein